MRLRIVPSLALARVLSTDEVVDADYFDLRRVALVRTGFNMANATPFEASIKNFLLSLQLVLKFGYFDLFLVHQLLETVLEFLFQDSFLLGCFGFPFFLLLF